MLTLVPLLAVLVTWDTSRMTGLGFLGIVLSTAALLQSGAQRSSALKWIAALNLLIPSYNVLLVEPVAYPFTGVYAAIHAALAWMVR